MNIPEFERTRGAKPGEIVDVVRGCGFAKYDKYLHSKVKKPDEYGVMLVPEAERALNDAFPEDKPTAPRRRDTHRLTSRVSCRLEKGRMELLQQALNRDGFETMQVGLSHIIDLYIEQEGKRNGAE